MLRECFPERNQMVLFDENLSDEELVEESYQKKNVEIGYRIAEKRLVDILLDEKADSK